MIARNNLKGVFPVTAPSDLLLERQISIGEVAFNNNRNIFGREVALQRVAGPSVAGFSIPGLSCAGWTGVGWVWYLGPRVYLNECVRDQIANLANVGAGTTAVAAATSAAGIVDIPYSALTALASAIMWTGGACIHEVDSWGGYRGVYWQLTYAYYISWWWH